MKTLKIRKAIVTICLIISSVYASAQVIRDSASIALPVKYNLLQSFNEGKMLTSDNIEVDYIKFIKKNIQFKDRPTLVFTWATFDKRGQRIIDSLLINKVYTKYNIVLINRNSKTFYNKDSEFILKTSTEYPLYSKYFISLYDFQNVFNFKDREATPMLFWLDKDFRIVTAAVTNEISINKIENLLSLVDSKNLVPSQTKYYSNRLIPSIKNEAYFKQIVTESNQITNINLTIISTNAMVYDFEFTKSTTGNYFFKDNTYIKKKQFSPYKVTDFPITRNSGLMDRAPNLYNIKSNFTLIYFCDIKSPEAKDRLMRLKRLFNESNNAENTNNYKSLYLDIVVIFIGEDSQFGKNNKFDSSTELQQMANSLTQDYYKVFDKDKAIQNKFEKNSPGSFHLLDNNKNVIYESEDDSLFALLIESQIKKK